MKYLALVQTPFEQIRTRFHKKKRLIAETFFVALPSNKSNLLPILEQVNEVYKWLL
jgi:hypothetical protein